ncbi:hypothetical protein ACFPPF_09930 [Xenophilus aerolatus]|nr:hypothetical protein [Xenophilus aerolatus]
MKLKVSKQPLTAVAAVWRGNDPETGWPRIRYAGQPFYGFGTMTEAADADAANVVPLKVPAAGLMVRCATTGRMMLFVGALLPASRAVAWAVLRQIGQVAPSSSQAPTPVPVTPVPALNDARRRQLDWFGKEMVRVRALQAAGMDPRVGLRFMVSYVGESRASLQRKFGKELPVPSKRGGRNFWPLSQIDAYAAGKSSVLSGPTQDVAEEVPA